jgi:RNA polymerase-binding transcription factor DksA
MDEFEEKIKKKLEEMRADILSKIKILPHISKEEMADITDFTSVEKVRNVENISISIYTDILKLIERALDKIQNGNYGYCEIYFHTPSLSSISTHKEYQKENFFMRIL